MIIAGLGRVISGETIVYVTLFSRFLLLEAILANGQSVLVAGWLSARQAYSLHLANIFLLLEVGLIY